MPALGGNMKPSVPPDATVPVARRSSYLKRFISGSATRPIVTAEAAAEPQSEAKHAQAMIVAEASPPRMWPTHA